MSGAGRLCGLTGAALLLALPACVETGDFGRVKRSAWNDMVAGTGSLAAAVRHEPVSGFPLTDDEGELRERAWRFLVPAGGRFTLDRVLAELVATRIVPASASDPDLATYLDDLLAADARSPVSRYRRLGDDVQADSKLIAPFATMAARVLRADRMRLQVLRRLEAPTPSEIADAEGRVAENRCLVAWVTSASAFRLRSYGYALERLVLAAPSSEAVGVERALARLAGERSTLEMFGLRPLTSAACLGQEPADAAPVRVPAEVVAKG